MSERTIAVLFAGVFAARAVVVNHGPWSVDLFFVALTGALVLLALARVNFRSSIGAPTPSWPLALALALLAVGVSFAPSVDEAWFNASVVLTPCIFAVAALVVDDRHRDIACVGLVGGGVLTSAAALNQRFVTWPDALRRREILELDPIAIAIMEGGRPVGLSMSPDLLSGLALSSLVLIFTLRPNRDGRRRIADIVVIAAGTVVLAAALIVTRSTTTFASIGVLVVVALLRLGRTKAAVIGPLVSLAVFSVAGRGIPAVLTSLGERIQNWSTALSLMVSNPLVPHGLGQYADLYAQHLSVDANTTLYAHSFPLQIGVELGVWGLAALFVGLVVVVRATRANPHPSPREAFASALPAALGVRLLVDYDGHVGQNAALYAAAIALSLRFAAGSNAASPTRNGQAEAPAPVPLRPATSHVGLALLTTTTLVVAFTAAVSLDARETLLSPYARGGEPSVDDDDALFAFADRHPDDSLVVSIAADRSVHALAACRANCTPLAEHAFARVAASLNVVRPLPMAHVASARFAVYEGRVDDAYDACQAAIDRDPRFFPAHQLRLQLALSTNDRARLTLFRRHAMDWLPRTERVALAAMLNRGRAP